MIEYAQEIWYRLPDEICCLCKAQRTDLKELGLNSSVLFENALVEGCLVLVLISLCVFFYKIFIRGKIRDAFWNFMDRIGLGILFFVVWCMGFVVYCAGGYSPGFGMLSIVFMSLIHATEMFVSGGDISAVHTAQHENAFYMFMFGLTHFLAIMCSLLFIIRQIGFFFVRKISAKLASLKPWGKRDATFVFWGINDASLLLAESIKEKANDKGEAFGSYSLVFVRTHDDAKRESEGFTPETIYEKIKIDRRELSRLRKLDCMVVSGNQRLSRLKPGEDNNILAGKLGLYTLSRIIKNKSHHTHIFMIGDDGEANIKAILNIKDDKIIKDGNVPIDIYCHCRKSAQTRSLEYYGLTHREEHTEIHIIDTSDLSVAQLKLNPECHPVQHSVINKDATIDSPFNAMIVGFGETGQEALRFIYEFGAFINSSKQKSPFHCTVFDKNMKEHEGLFLAQTPYLQTSDEVSFYEYGIDTPDYWHKVEELLVQLNYIVVCPGNDVLALETTSNLCSLAMRLRAEHSPKRLTICVRSYASREITRLEDLCSDINAKYQVYGIQVVPFGQKESIFSYDSIVDDRLLKMAMEYHYAYEGSPENITPKDLWYRRMGYENKGNYYIDEIEEIERKCKQNYCNALHGATKLHILDQCSTRRDISNEIRENIARLEHERWVACMRINGWQRLDKPIVVDGNTLKTRLTTRKLHTDICPWEEIRSWDPKDQQITQGYDYKVLDTTLKLAK